MNPYWIAALLLALPVSCRTAPVATLDGPVVDLTHAFDEATVYWPTAEGFHLEVVEDGPTPGGYYYRANRFATAEHGGTHLDAPSHFHDDGRPVDAIPVEQLVGPGVVVDVRDRAAADRDYRVGVEDLTRFERAHGRIPDGALVLLWTGWGERWPDALSYLGTARTGSEAVAELHFPGLGADAARWLVREGRIRAVGIDTASIDHGPSRGFEAHRVLSAANVPALENVANLGLLPATDFSLIALPMKIRGGSGGPVRIVALLPPGSPR